jgi:uncharacterized protein
MFSFKSPAPVLSPCIGVCALNAAGLCDGCHRSIEEITRWLTYSDAERQHIMNDVLPQRAHSRSPS